LPHLLAMRPDTIRTWGRFDRPLETHELIVAGIIVLLLGGTLVWQLLPQRRPRDFNCNNPSRLFTELCRAHRLDRSHRKLLKRLAAAHGLKSAAVLFMEPEYFDATNVPPDLKPSARELRQLRHVLFD
jgi:hypothetical protein